MATAEFSWIDMFSRIRKADEANSTLEIDLPIEVWEALNKHGFDGLKERLSTRAASRLFLHKEESRHYLLVARFGSCFPLSICPRAC